MVSTLRLFFSCGGVFIILAYPDKYNQALSASAFFLLGRFCQNKFGFALSQISVGDLIKLHIPPPNVVLLTMTHYNLLDVDFVKC